MKILESEHCHQPDSNVPFDTSNYAIKSTPAREWKITMERDAQLADMRHGRRLPDIDELHRSEPAMKAGLALGEVAALVLYTGPMVGPRRSHRGDACAPAHVVPRARAFNSVLEFHPTLGVKCFHFLPRPAAAPEKS